MKLGHFKVNKFLRVMFGSQDVPVLYWDQCNGDQCYVEVSVYCVHDDIHNALPTIKVVRDLCR